MEWKTEVRLQIVDFGWQLMLVLQGSPTFTAGFISAKMHHLYLMGSNDSLKLDIRE